MRRKTTGAALVVALGLATVAAPGVFASDPKTAEQTALDFVRGGGLGLGSADVDDLSITDSVPSVESATQHVYLRQQHRGLDVLGAEATVSVQGGKVVHSGSRLISNLDTVATGRQVLDARAAFTAAARGLGLAAPTGVRVLADARGLDSRTVLTEGGVAAKPVRAHLTYQGLEDGTARLAWLLDLELPTAEHWYLASVDAETGALLTSVDLVVSEKAEHTAAALARPAHFGDHAHADVVDPFADATPDGASYKVFAYPLESPNDGPRTVVKNPADLRFSPYGWHDTDGKPGVESTLTQGNNVIAAADTVNDDLPDPLSQPDGGASLTFDNPFTPTDPTALQNRAAAVTNLFYWNNTIHDVLANYGFDEASGNFQVTNYTGQGKGGDQVKAQAQDGGGTNNANFGTPADGSQPRMQMYLWDPAVTALIGDTADARAQLLDGDFDSGVIAHEYGHGVSNRLTGGPSNVSCLSTSQVQEQMGEGWSDFFGVGITMRPGDKGETARGLGTYVLYDSDRTGDGIRPAPYSTLMSVNPATYDQVKTAAAPHGVGYVWASMLYEVYWNLVEKHGFNPELSEGWETGGNNLAFQLVMDGMKFQPCKPGFVDGRNAILAADQALTGGANACEIWRGFAKRGLGTNASQGTSASKTDGKQGFAVPAACK